jgi:hypothetical protein
MNTQISKGNTLAGSLFVPTFLMASFFIFLRPFSKLCDIYFAQLSCQKNEKGKAIPVTGRGGP